MQMYQILILEPDTQARQLLARMVEPAGFVAEAVSNLPAAHEALSTGTFDLVLTEIDLPVDEGLGFCQHVPANFGLPLVVVSAHCDPATIVRALDSGADDYLRKPVDAHEMAGRLRAVLRRARRLPPEASYLPLDKLDLGCLQLDFANQVANLCGVELELTCKEFLLLHTLAKNIGTVLTRAHILQTVWRDDVYDDSKTLDVHISRLRKKLDAACGRSDILKTVRRRGYMLTEEVLDCCKR